MKRTYDAASEDQKRQATLLRQQLTAYLGSKTPKSRVVGIRTNYRQVVKYEFAGMPYAEIMFADAAIKDATGALHPVTPEMVQEVYDAVLKEGTPLSEHTLEGMVRDQGELEPSYRAYEGVKLSLKGSTIYLVFGVARELIMRTTDHVVPKALPPFPQV